MTRDELVDYFSDESNDEFLKFDRVKPLYANRPDLNAFLLLEHICPDEHDIIGGAEHDQIWLKVDIDRLAERASEEHLLTLVRCGVFYDSEVDSLSMFV